MAVFTSPTRLAARVTDYADGIDRLVYFWGQEILRRFQTEVVPAARKRLPYRTGRLFRSVRVDVKQWEATVSAVFYGRFVGFEALLRDEWRKRRGTITRQAFRVARLKSGRIL